MARAIIGREAAFIRIEGKEADATAVWMRLVGAAGKMREPPPTLVAATLARLQRAYGCIYGSDSTPVHHAEHICES